MNQIIDFHTHAFPDALAPRAIAKLTETAASSGYRPNTDGTVAGLLAAMDAAGVSRSVVCNIATNATQMRKVNDFALETARRYDRLIPLGSLHPLAKREEMAEELDRLAAGGIRGIKIHPDYVGVTLDDPAFDPVFELAAARSMFVVTHAGFDPVSPDKTFCTPDMILRVLEAHPTLRLVAAHTGGFDRETEVLDKLCGKDVYLDTSLSALRAARDAAWGERCAAILRSHRPDRLLFASDTPWSDPAAELTFLFGCGLSEDTFPRILWRNAEELLKTI